MQEKAAFSTLIVGSVTTAVFVSGLVAFDGVKLVAVRVSPLLLSSVVGASSSSANQVIYKLIFCQSFPSLCEAVLKLTAFPRNGTATNSTVTVLEVNWCASSFQVITVPNFNTTIYLLAIFTGQRAIKARFTIANKTRLLLGVHFVIFHILLSLEVTNGRFYKNISNRCSRRFSNY